MNDEQQARVTLAAEAALVAGAGRLPAPVARIEDRATAAKNTIIESAVTLAADMKALYQERVDYWQAQLDAASKTADQLVARAQKTAEEVATQTERDRKIAADYARVAEENGIELGSID